MFKQNLEKTLLGLSLVVLAVLVVGGLLVSDDSQDALRDGPGISGLLYQPEALPTIQPAQFEWPSFGPQRGERGWEFALFTPPNVWFDPDEEQFFPFPPSLPEREVEIIEPVGPVEVEVPFGVILTSLEEIPFHIVLTGYIGEESDFFLNLRNEETGVSFLSRAGREHPDDHQIRIDSFRRVRFEDDGIFRSFGEMTVTNLRTGEQYVLRDGERTGTGQFRAEFRAEGNDATFTVEEGDEFELNGLLFTLAQINLEEESVVVQRLERETGHRDVATLELNQAEIIVRLVENDE